MVKTLRFHCREFGFDPWSGKIPHAALCDQKKKKAYYLKKIGHHLCPQGQGENMVPIRFFKSKIKSEVHMFVFFLNM